MTTTSTTFYVQCRQHQLRKISRRDILEMMYFGDNSFARKPAHIASLFTWLMTLQPPFMHFMIYFNFMLTCFPRLECVSKPSIAQFLDRELSRDNIVGHCLTLSSIGTRLSRTTVVMHSARVLYSDFDDLEAMDF